MANFLLFECLKPQARKVLVDCAPKNWKPPHSDFGGIRQHAVNVAEDEELRLSVEIEPTMKLKPHYYNGDWRK